MKLWVKPESSRAVTMMRPSWTTTCMVSRVRTPDIACKEICGAESEPSTTASAAAVALPAISETKRRAQTQSWPLTYFSSQLKHCSLWRCSSNSLGERRRTVRPATVAVLGGAAANPWGCVDVDPNGVVATGCGAGRRPREGGAVERPAHGGGAAICSRHS